MLSAEPRPLELVSCKTFVPVHSNCRSAATRTATTKPRGRNQRGTRLQRPPPPPQLASRMDSITGSDGSKKKTFVVECHLICGRLVDIKSSQEGEANSSFPGPVAVSSPRSAPSRDESPGVCKFFLQKHWKPSQCTLDIHASHGAAPGAKSSRAAGGDMSGAAGGRIFVCT